MAEFRPLRSPRVRSNTIANSCRRRSKGAQTRPVGNRVIRCLWPLKLPTDGQTKRTLQPAAARRIPGLRCRTRYRVPTRRGCRSAVEPMPAIVPHSPQVTCGGKEQRQVRTGEFKGIRVPTRTQTGRGFGPSKRIGRRPIRERTPTKCLSTDGHRLLAVYGLARGRVWAVLHGR